MNTRPASEHRRAATPRRAAPDPGAAVLGLRVERGEAGLAEDHVGQQPAEEEAAPLDARRGYRPPAGRPKEEASAAASRSIGVPSWVAEVR